MKNNVEALLKREPQELNFTCPLPPSVNSYLGKKISYSCGKPYVQVFETAEAKSYKLYMKKVLSRALKNSSWKATDSETYVDCELVIYMPNKKRDSDNIFKVLIDSIKEFGLFYDDTLIIPRVKNVFIDKDNPRVEVNLKVDDKIGVFDNRYELNSFISKNCSDCKRYAKKCSLLKKSLENRLLSEISLQNTSCDKKCPI